MGKLDHLITPFAAAVASGQTEVYNEFSLQHELGMFLRERLPNYKVQFERNVSFFFHPSNVAFTKREIDIAVYSPDKKELTYSIELKYPRNGQHPEQMFSFCKDVAFAEELNIAGFQTAALVIFADDHLFYRGATGGIYAFFRGGKPLHGRIQRPTGSKDTEVRLRGRYDVNWKPISESLRYAVIEVGHGD